MFRKGTGLQRPCMVVGPLGRESVEPVGSGHVMSGQRNGLFLNKLVVAGQVPMLVMVGADFGRQADFGVGAPA